MQTSVGLVIGNKYRIEELIGEGGLAEVYKAIRLDFNEPVAIKLLYPQHARNEILKMRLINEAKIQFNLLHPNIVRVFDLINEDNQFGLVMDWVEGTDLLEWIRNKPIPVPTSEIVRLFILILDAMSFAHNHNVIHRDLKPQNILMKSVTGQEIPMIADFGIAKMVDESRDGHTPAFQTIGTPEYMAPEQIENAKDVDFRADIYSIGAMLFRVSTGHFPFRGDTVIETMMKHLKKPIPKLISMNANADIRLQCIIDKSMQKDPNQRYSNCAEFASHLKSIEDTTHADFSIASFMSSFSDKEIVFPLQTQNSLEQFQEISNDSEKNIDNTITINPVESIRTHIYQSNKEKPYSLHKLFFWILFTVLSVTILGYLSSHYLLNQPTRKAVVQIQVRKLNIITSPPGIEVRVNGKLKGNSPLAITSLKSSNAPLIIQLSKTDYMNHSIQWNQKKNQILNIQMRASIQLTCKTVPSGAELYYNGRKLGKTPLKIMIEKGKKTNIVFKKKGYISHSIQKQWIKKETIQFYLAPSL